MAQHKSAIKRIRRNNRANVGNSQYMSAVRTAVKKFRLAALSAAQETFDKSTLQPLFTTAQSLLAKAGAKGVLHRNNVARRIGRLSAILKSAQAGEVAAADRKAVKKSAAVKRAEANAKPAVETKAAKAAPAKGAKTAKVAPKTATKAPPKKK